MDDRDSPPAGPAGEGPVDGEQRGGTADDRDVDLAEREETLRTRDRVHEDREQQTQDILDDADERDQRADARDSVADDRDRAASCSPSSMMTMGAPGYRHAAQPAWIAWTPRPIEPRPPTIGQSSPAATLCPRRTSRTPTESCRARLGDALSSPPWGSPAWNVTVVPGLSQSSRSRPIFPPIR